MIGLLIHGRIPLKVVDKGISVFGGSGMGRAYRLWNQNQQDFPPPSVLDWLSKNGLVYFILDTANKLDISAITAKYEQEELGFPPYNPRTMMTLGYRFGKSAQGAPVRSIQRIPSKTLRLSAQGLSPFLLDFGFGKNFSTFFHCSFVNLHRSLAIITTPFDDQVYASRLM